MKQILIFTSIIFAVVQRSWAFYDQGSQVVALEAGGGLFAYKADIPYSFVGLGGLVSPSPQQINVTEAGGSFGASYLYYLTPHLGLGMLGNYSETGLDDQSTLLFDSLQTRLRSKSTVVLGVAKYSFLVEHHVMPYLLAGIGFHHSSRELTAQPAGGLEWSDTNTTEERILGDSSGTSYALAYGVGMDIPIGEKIFLGAEFRYEYLGRVNYTVNALGQSLGANLGGSTNLLNYLVKLGYKF